MDIFLQYMNNLFKLGLLIVSIGLTACDRGEKTQNNLQLQKFALAADSSVKDDGLVTTPSPYDVSETSDRLESIIKDKGLTIFNHIDHSVNAANAELELNPTQVIIFGNPQVGTPLMKCSPTTAIDLPQKILIYQDSNNQTQVVYNGPQYLKQRHNITDCDSVLKKVSGTLKNIVETAI